MTPFPDSATKMRRPERRAPTAKKKPTTWRITVIRKKGERLGTVEAATEAEAIKVAIETFGLTEPERRRRLAAHRIDS